MRKILFKAKRVDNREWVEGFYLKYIKPINGEIEHRIFVSGSNGITWYKVEENTICQYTGLTDKNGNKIWENDIVSEDWGSYKGIIRFGLFESIVLQNIGFSIEWKKAISYRQDLFYWADKIEVIGNTFDNADLLKGE